MKLKYGVAVVLLALPLFAYAEGCSLNSGGYGAGGNTFAGATTCSKATLDSVTVKGPLTIKDSTIATVIVNGKTKVEEATIAHLTVNGALTVEKAKIDQLILKGALEATDSDIADITIAGGLTLKDSKVKNITINNDSISGADKIYLKGKTQVEGDITFTNGKGVVYQDKDAELKGKVIGGKVEVAGK